MKDLVVLSACTHIRSALDSVLKRHQSLQIREISYEFLVHPENDPGCIHTPHNLLRAQRGRFHNALVVLDKDGCGKERRPILEIARDIRQLLESNGWPGRANAIIIEPEVDAWAWSASPEVDRILGWHNRIPRLRTWLVDEGWIPDELSKPADPKNALIAALRRMRKKHTSAIFKDLGESLSLANCTDKSFRRLCKVLRGWFPCPPNASPA